MVERADPVVAVYGTLRRGERNHHLLDRATFVGSGRIRGVLYDVPAARFRGYPYPALVDSGAGSVVVELYRLSDDAQLRVLDVLERYDPADERGSQYLRRTLTILGSGITHAYAYVYNGPPDDLGAPIPDGDWVQYAQSTQHR